MPARITVRDRPREELLDGPVEDRDDDEDGRPQQRDPPVVVLRERMRREREVRVRDEASDADPHTEDRGALAVATRRGQAPSSTGTASGPPRPCRGARASRRTSASTSG